jgi:hypothetical protein
MATIDIPASKPASTEDPFYPAAVDRVKSAVAELKRKGIIDVEGKRIRQGLPPDMQEDSERDFGG